jgi:hypothetical protein
MMMIVGGKSGKKERGEQEVKKAVSTCAFFLKKQSLC